MTASAVALRRGESKAQLLEVFDAVIQHELYIKGHETVLHKAAQSTRSRLLRFESRSLDTSPPAQPRVVSGELYLSVKIYIPS